MEDLIKAGAYITLRPLLHASRMITWQYFKTGTQTAGIVLRTSIVARDSLTRLASGQKWDDMA